MIEVYKPIHGIYMSGDSLLSKAPTLAVIGYEYKLKKVYCYSPLTSNFFLLQSCQSVEQSPL